MVVRGSRKGEGEKDEAMKLGMLLCKDLPGQPQETLGGSVLLLLDLVDDELLQRLALAGLLDLAVAEFLSTLSYGMFGRGEVVVVRGGRTVMLPVMSDLTGLKAAEPRTSVWRGKLG